jgi:predicted small lipoprotein YifL
MVEGRIGMTKITRRMVVVGFFTSILISCGRKGPNIPPSDQPAAQQTQKAK